MTIAQRVRAIADETVPMNWRLRDESFRPWGFQRRGNRDQVSGQFESLPEKMVEAACDIAGELRVLHLIAADGHDVRTIEQDVRRHEDRVCVKAHIYVGVEVLLAFFFVSIDRRLVSVRAIH